MSINIIKKISGLSLLEVLIAGGIIAMILGSSIALGRGITRNQIVVQDRTLAYSLASESAEILRNMRDSTKFAENKSFDSYIPAGCAKRKVNPDSTSCKSLEIIWDASTNGWRLENNSDRVIRNIETDLEPTVEAIEYDVRTGVISDNTSRRKQLDSGGRWFDVASKVSCQIEQPLTNKIVFCRQIILTPFVYDQGSDQNYTTDPSQTDPGAGEDNFILPYVSEENAADRSAEPTEYTFDSLLQNDYRAEIIIYWWEMGKKRQIRLSDSIANWQ